MGKKEITIELCRQANIQADPNYGKLKPSTSTDSLNKLANASNGGDSATSSSNDLAGAAAKSKEEEKEKDKAGNETKKKGRRAGAADKDPYAPSSAQVQSMLDDML